MNSTPINIPSRYELIYRATNFACQMHQNQKRKDGETPYISHLLRVAWILRDLFGCDDPEVISAGILHDTIEDTAADYDDILHATSDRVATLVAALTKDMRIPEDQREILYDHGLAKAPWEARLIKLADVYDNLCDSILSNESVHVIDKVDRALILAGDDPRLQTASDHLRALSSTSNPSVR